ncbi:MAG: endonuclease V [Armatimonadota bacterium]|nr:endonuclease V [Armatimonadota bacterium]
MRYVRLNGTAPVGRLLPWAASAEELIATQVRLGHASPDGWHPRRQPSSVAACFVCFRRGRSGPGEAGDAGWAAAVFLIHERLADAVVAQGPAGGPYQPGLLALREGPLLEEAVRRLAGVPEVLLVNATGRDHPRRAGLALHLGARLGVPTIGITSRTLVATGAWPEDRAGARSPLLLADTPEPVVVGYWVRPRAGVRPLAVHAAWRTDAATAASVVWDLMRAARTPEPLRQARRLAREARARDARAELCADGRAR